MSCRLGGWQIMLGFFCQQKSAVHEVDAYAFAHGVQALSLSACTQQMVCDSLSFCVVKGLVADDTTKTLLRDKSPSWMDGPWWLNSLLDPLGDACGRVFFPYGRWDEAMFERWSNVLGATTSTSHAKVRNEMPKIEA